VANAKKNHKLVVEVEDVDGGECFVSARGTFTPMSATLLLVTAMQFCLRSPNVTFDQIIEGLKEQVEQGEYLFEPSEFFSGSSTN
jgi:hypothetical protein